MSGRAQAIAWQVVKFLANSSGLGWHTLPPEVFDRVHSGEEPQAEPRVDRRELDAWLASVLGHDDPAGNDRAGPGRRWRRYRRPRRFRDGARALARGHGGVPGPGAVPNPGALPNLGALHNPGAVRDPGTVPNPGAVRDPEAGRDRG